MCSFNVRKTKHCSATPKHTFKEVILCEVARVREPVVPCDENTWENLRNVAKTATSIVCAICNGVRYVIREQP